MWAWTISSMSHSKKEKQEVQLRPHFLFLCLIAFPMRVSTSPPPAAAPPLKGRRWTVQNKKAPLEGETGEAPPAAEKASRFRGSGAIGGLARDRESLCRDGAAVSKAD